MILDQINSQAMNCDMKNGMELQSSDPQVAKAIYPVCEKDRDSIFSGCEEDEFCRLARLSSAPIYAFDEDGDILPQTHSYTPRNSVGSDPDDAPSATQSEGKICVADSATNASQSSGDTVEAAPFAGDITDTEIWLIDDETKPSVMPHRNGQSHVATREEDVPKSPTEKEGSEGLKNAEAPPPRAKTVPTIDLHAASIEVVEDYLENDTGDDRLRDCCSMVVAHPGQRSATGEPSQGSIMTYLTAHPQQDPAPKRVRVPFHTVVFTERKPSTGDALIRSLGLGTPGASSSIQDLTSINQDAVRDRLQLENRWTHQCTSCGVSPEECLEKLGLNTNHAKSMTLYPKSERLWQFLQQVQTKLSRPRRPRTPSYSGPLNDTTPETSPTHAHPRSLVNSPPSSPLEDTRQPRLNTY